MGAGAGDRQQAGKEEGMTVSSLALAVALLGSLIANIALLQRLKEARRELDKIKQERCW